MFGNRLVELGKQIGTIAKAIKMSDIELDALSRAIDDRKLFITPEGGWVGKNEAERGVAANKTFASDEDLIKMVDSKIAETKKQQVLVSDLALFEAERRGIEFAVRDALAKALGGYDESGPEFDTVADKEVDGRYFKKTQDGSYETLPPIPEGTPPTKIVNTVPVEKAVEPVSDPVPEKKPIELDEEEKRLLDKFGPTPGTVVKTAPKADVEATKTPPAKPEVSESAPDVDQMLKDMGF